MSSSPTLSYRALLDVPGLRRLALWAGTTAVAGGDCVAAAVIGRGLGGAVIAVVGTTWALAVPALLSFAAPAVVIGMNVPAPPSVLPTAGILRDAREGLLYVVRN